MFKRKPPPQVIYVQPKPKPWYVRAWRLVAPFAVVIVLVLIYLIQSARLGH